MLTAEFTREAFLAQAARVGATVHRTALAEAPALAVTIASGTGCRTVAFADALPGRPTFARAFSSAGITEVSSGDLWPTRRADAGLSAARLAVAETGSLLLHSASADRRVELCTDVHLVLVDAATLVPTLDAAFDALREISRRPPAYAALLSGPSRSADIERQITIGVHGPRELHVLLLEPAP